MSIMDQSLLLTKKLNPNWEMIKIAKRGTLLPKFFKLIPDTANICFWSSRFVGIDRHTNSLLCTGKELQIQDFAYLSIETK